MIASRIESCMMRWRRDDDHNDAMLNTIDLVLRTGKHGLNANRFRRDGRAELKVRSLIWRRSSWCKLHRVEAAPKAPKPFRGSVNEQQL